MIHGERKMWRREEAWVGWESQGKKGRLGHLMGMGGEGEPPESDKARKLCSKWARDCRRRSGDTNRYVLPLLHG